MRCILLLSLVLLVAGASQAAHAHTTVSVGPYDIEVGWGTEPPVVGLRNTIVFEISEPGESEGVKSGVNNAFANLAATIKSGGLSKTLDINADVRAGHYHSPILPTKAGSMEVNVLGEINGVPVNVDVPIEDVETTAILDFPPRQSTGSGDVAALKAAVSSLQQEVNRLPSGSEEGAVGPAYDLAVFGMSIGAAGVVLAVIAMIKRIKN